MKLVFDTFDGVTINDGINVEADFPDGLPLVNPASPLVVDMLDRPSKTVGRRLTGSTLTFLVRPLGTGAAWRAQRETIRDLFRTEEKFQYKTLVCTDADDSDREWSLQVAVLSCTPKDDAFIVIVVPDDPFWTSPAINASFTYLASGTSHDFTISTPSPHKVHPRITLTLGGSKASGYLYQLWVPIKSPAIASGIWSFDIGESLDTAALVLAGKMRADGYDVRVLIDGVEVPRWFGTTFNTANTKIWVNLNIPLRYPVQLGAALNAVDTPLEIRFNGSYGIQNRTWLQSWPSEGDFVIGTEGFHYTSKTSDGWGVTGITRGIKGTTKTVHALNDYCYSQPFDLRIVYGNPSATDPGYSNDTQPTIFLDTSTNLIHNFDLFGANSGIRYPKFTPNRGLGASQNTEQGFYTTLNRGHGDPWSCMGCEATSYMYQGAWRADNVNNYWQIVVPYRYLTFWCRGLKTKHATSWPSFTRLCSSPNGSDWVERFRITEPSLLDIGQNWEFTSEILYENGIMFQQQGSITALENNVAFIECFDMTINYYDVDVPVFFHGNEAPSYDYSLTVENTLNGTFFQLRKTVQQTQTIVIDCLNHTVQVDGTDSSLGLIPGDDYIWFEMESGVNPIELTDTGMASVTVAIEGDAERWL